ncbi:MAG: heavy metal translocating P-type ATPase metal-binding domain-containing protein [Bacteroidia bacterium]|nr:heavy metal translocating P-type ATPase metal-binding domain-containing protein [Bacteroidia bacterium]
MCTLIVSKGMIATTQVNAGTEHLCYHCGQACDDELNVAEEKNFCCFGCKTVYEILNDNNLCDYYSFETSPGVSLRYVSDKAYAFLNEPSIRKKILEFDSSGYSKVKFLVPSIHCISCIWLLENLQKLNKAILKSEVNFSKKTVSVDFDPQVMELSALAQLMTSLGYAPQISLAGGVEQPNTSKSLITKLAIAGFCFGNIMLLSFPEYLGLDVADDTLRKVFSFLNLSLAVPVILYSGQEYFLAAWKSFRQRQINIDVPIALGLLALFARSANDIVSNTGPGYLDSLSGLVFFLLIGRWFQSKTYESLSFERDYKSFFPLSAQKKVGDEWKATLVYELQKGDEIRVRNMEVVPADCLLLTKDAFIDYSFVTGESKPVKVEPGDLIYAGGRLVGSPIILVVEKETSQSHLTSLWNNVAFAKAGESVHKKTIDNVARKFTWIVLGLALITAMYWYVVDPSRMWLILTAVLMVACPCALALAAPFTYGSMLRVFGKYGFYLKNADVIERLSSITAFVFDKTGTITRGSEEVKFMGSLKSGEFAAIKVMTAASSHPLSILISKSIVGNDKDSAEDFKEIPGKGIEGIVKGMKIRIGSPGYLSVLGVSSDQGTKVFVEINGEIKGYFQIGASLRKELPSLLQRLNGSFVSLLSGDHEGDKKRMAELFPANAPLFFNQSPHQKLTYISDLQKQKMKVMMIGDGLNDSGALKQSDVGIAVADDTSIFTPACDAILTGENLKRLDTFILLAKKATTILRVAFGISFFYNFVALSFAMSGHLTPLVAAILMPISSISVVGFSTLAVNVVSSRKLSVLSDPKN